MSSAACRIRCRVAALAPGTSRITVDTSAVETPTLAATSASVGRRSRPGCGGSAMPRPYPMKPITFYKRVLTPGSSLHHAGSITFYKHGPIDTEEQHAQGLGKVREAVCRWHISWSVAV